MPGRIEIDIEIDPLALGRDFEFLVSADILEIRAEKNLRDIPLPKFVRLALRFGIGLEVELLERANEKEVEVLCRPAGAHLGAIARHGITAPVVFEINGRNSTPEFGRGIGVRGNVSIGELARELVWFRGSSRHDAEPRERRDARLHAGRPMSRAALPE